MKKIIGLVMSIVLGFTVVIGFSGCGARVEGEKIDPKRTQLYVGTYDGGVGDVWLEKAKVRFEELNKERSFESGKKGVQIFIDKEKGTMSGTSLKGTIKRSRDEVFFTEEVPYYEFISKGLLYDISDVVTEVLSEYGETKSIEDKLSTTQQEYYKTTDGKYYGIPFWEAYNGITYDEEVFEEKLLYFSDEVENGNRKFINSLSDKKSAGGDNKYDTYDDGLPATYDEFFALMDKMVPFSIVPIAWSGANQDYFNFFLGSLMADYEGADNMMLNYTFDGVADIASINDSGELTIRKETINNSNGYLLANQPGAYYATKFAHQLISNNKYYNSLSFSPSQSNTGLQDDFLRGFYDDKIEDIGMMIDGTWWENEAESVFTDMELNSYPGKKERRLAFMPYPKATPEKVGSKQTLTAILDSSCFINGNIKENKVELAKEFLKFCHTDTSLVEFSQTTSIMKPYMYDMTQEQLDVMTNFGRSVFTNKQASDIVYPYSTNPIYKADGINFRTSVLLSSKINGMDYSMVSNSIKDRQFSVKQIFDGFLTKRQERWSNYVGL